MKRIVNIKMFSIIIMTILYCGNVYPNQNPKNKIKKIKDVRDRRSVKGIKIKLETKFMTFDDKFYALNSKSNLFYSEEFLSYILCSFEAIESKYNLHYNPFMKFLKTNNNFSPMFEVGSFSRNIDRCNKIIINNAKEKDSIFVFDDRRALDLRFYLSKSDKNTVIKTLKKKTYVSRGDFYNINNSCDGSFIYNEVPTFRTSIATNFFANDSNLYLTHFDDELRQVVSPNKLNISKMTDKQLVSYVLASSIYDWIDILIYNAKNEEIIVDFKIKKVDEERWLGDLFFKKPGDKSFKKVYIPIGVNISYSKNIL